MVIGFGAVLGLSLWGLASWDSMRPVTWVILGIAAAIITGIGWRIGRRTRPTPPAPVPAAATGDGGRSATQARNIRVDFRAYGLTAFAAVGQFLVGLSQQGEPTAGKWLPDASAFRLPDWMYYVLVGIFLVAAFAFFTGAAVPRLGRWLSERFALHRWAEAPVGVITVSGVAIGWLGNLELATAMPTFLVYPYLYGGLFIFSVVSALFVWDSGRFGRKAN